MSIGAKYFDKCAGLSACDNTVRNVLFTLLAYVLTYLLLLTIVQLDALLALDTVSVAELGLTTEH